MGKRGFLRPFAATAAALLAIPATAALPVTPLTIQTADRRTEAATPDLVLDHALPAGTQFAQHRSHSSHSSHSSHASHSSHHSSSF